jgi:hypothetical protein
LILLVSKFGRHFALRWSMKERGALLIHRQSHFPRFCRGVATVLFFAATGAFADDDWQRQQEENRRLDEQRYQQQVREDRARDDAEYARQQRASREGFERQQAYAAKAEQFRYQSVERALLRPTTSSVPDELNLNGCKSSVLNVPTAQGTYTQETGFFAPKGEQPFFQATIGFGQSGELGWLRLKAVVTVDPQSNRWKLVQVTGILAFKNERGQETRYAATSGTPYLNEAVADAQTGNFAVGFANLVFTEILPANLKPKRVPACLLRLKFEVRAKWSPGNATAYSRSFF